MSGNCLTLNCYRLYADLLEHLQCLLPAIGELNAAMDLQIEEMDRVSAMPNKLVVSSTCCVYHR